MTVAPTLLCGYHVHVKRNGAARCREVATHVFRNFTTEELEDVDLYTCVQHAKAVARLERDDDGDPYFETMERVRAA